MDAFPLISEALSHMQRIVPCPEDVKTRIASLRVPVEDNHDQRITTNWRSGPRTNARPTYTRAPAPPTQRFGNRGRTDISVEERMMDRIRDKMNKFSPKTYDTTKGWLCQLLDSGETDFLTDFITLVFEKAAVESTFCALYARLITELRDEFPHLNTELMRIFREYMNIFAKVRDEPDVSSADYATFLRLRDQRKYRRGYSAFLGEIIRLKVLGTADLLGMCSLIVDELIAAKKEEEQQLLCEEYADCLRTLVTSCGIPPAELVDLKDRIMIGMEKKDSPSLTNKARFGLMDILDLF